MKFLTICLFPLNNDSIEAAYCVEQNLLPENTKKAIPSNKNICSDRSHSILEINPIEFFYSTNYFLLFLLVEAEGVLRTFHIHLTWNDIPSVSARGSVKYLKRRRGCLVCLKTCRVPQGSWLASHAHEEVDVASRDASRNL